MAIIARKRTNRHRAAFKKSIEEVRLYKPALWHPENEPICSKKKMKRLILLIYFLPFGINGQVLDWTFETKGPIHNTPVINESIVYIGSADGLFYALSEADGSQKWSYNSKSPIYTDAAIWNDLVFFSNEAGRLIALNKHTGKLEWQFQAEPESSQDLWDYYRSSPVVWEERIFWGNGDGNLYALDARTGIKNWSFQTEGPIHASAVVDNGTVFIGNFKGRLYAIDTETGVEKWKFQAIGSHYFPNAEFQRAPLVHNEKIYIGSRDLNLYVLNKETGRGIWHFTEPGGSWIIATPLVHEGKVFFGSSDTYTFYALSEKSGKEKWNIRTYTRSYGSPLSYTSQILFPGFDGKIRAVEPETGNVLWTYQTHTSKINYGKLYDENGKFRTDLKINSALQGEQLINALGPIVCTPLLIGQSLIFGSVDGKIYKIQLP